MFPFVWNGSTWDRLKGSGGTASVADAAASAALGTTADSAYAGSGTTTTIAALKGVYSELSTILTQLQSATPAGSNTIGSVTQSGAPWSDVVTGNVASATADSGNPVKIGGVYNSTLPTLSAGQRGDAQLDSTSLLRVNIAPNQTAPASSIAADGQANSNGLIVDGRSQLWNGTTWDRVYSATAASSTTRLGVVAVAIVPLSGTGNVTSATVGTTSAQALAAATRSQILEIQNVSASASVACSLGGTAALNTAGSFQIASGALLVLSSQTYVPGDAINCIASAAATPITILAK